MGLDTGAAGWSLTRRVVFRFTFAYLILFTFFKTLGNVLPVNPLYALLWDPIVGLVGTRVFGVTVDLRLQGAGDTTYHYVQLACFLALAAVVTAVWSVLDRGRADYDRLHDWLRAILRYSLGVTMIVYGVAKFYQFPSPLPVEWLAEPLGEGSPMQLLWSFMGASKTYALFTGVAEVIGGLLLFRRRTALLGALVCIGVLANVVMLNFCYDVPVKILSSHLLFMAVLLTLPDLRRLADLLVFNRPAQPAVDQPLFERAWLNRVGTVAAALFVFVSVAFASVLLPLALFANAALTAPTEPVAGAWEVEEFEVAGQVRPPLLSDEVRWRRVFVSEHGFGVQRMSQASRHYLVRMDSEAKTLTLTDPDDPQWKCALSYQEPEPGALALEGTYDGRPIRAKLRRIERSEFPLVKRGFRWAVD